MKKYTLGILALLTLIITSCAKDNYDEPGSILNGKIVSATSKNPIGVKNQSEGGVQVQLYQDGYELQNVPITVSVNQDGTFSASLFNGTYKLVTKDNNGPWINDRDTLVVQVKGSTTVDYTVRPYFELNNVNFNLSGTTLTATFDIVEVNAVQDRGLGEVTLFVGKTVFVDDGFSAKKENAASPAVGSNTITMDISDIASNPILYARVGVKINGVEQRLYNAGSVRVK